MTSATLTVKKKKCMSKCVHTRAILRFAGVAGALAFIAVSCGQQDPTFRPGPGNTRQTGSIAVTSSIPGATITLDGIATGRVTPDTLRERSVGTHRLRVFLGGYDPDPVEQEVEVEADLLHAVHFELVLIQGAGSIAVEAPYPAEIFLDGTFTGATAPDTIAASSGQHTVTLDLPGFRNDPEEISLTVLADLVVAAPFDLVAPKVVVCEDFSNYGCLPCVPADAALKSALSRIQPGRAMSLNPHLNFPATGDPMYQFNPDAATARQFLFQVAQMPAIFANGVRIQDPTSADAIQAAIEAELGTAPPMAIGVRSSLGAAEFQFTVDVWGLEGGIPSDLLLFSCVVETAVTLDPPGPNGLSEYRNVLRHFFRLPDPPGDLGGEELGDLPAGTRRTFEYVYPLPGGDVDPAHLAAIAFVQERAGDRRVIQAGTSFSP